jgi:uncharacterized protein YfiM (DUF2279 family)
MSEIPSKRRWWRFFIWPLAALLLLVFLALETTPATLATPAPDAAQVRVASDGFDRLRRTLKAGETRDFAFSEAELNAGLKLAARSRGIDRAEASIGAATITMALSKPWRFGLWLNVTAWIGETNAGFPSVSAKLGDLPIPAFLCRFLIKRYWNSRDANMPLLDELAQKLTLQKGVAIARVKLPNKSGVLTTLGAARANPVDPKHVARIFCELGRMQAKAPVRGLTDQVHRAFSTKADTVIVEHNRAAFVALAMYVADRRIGEATAGLKLSDVSKCQRPATDITLLRRADLAKHWALSAALTAAFGAEMSGAMGTWKEIADSGRGGSGFSFVDLAADRSGVLHAARAVDPASAAATAAKLSRISETALLPLQALALSEGMSEAEFQSQFVDTEAAAYQKVVARIDRILSGKP